MTAMVAVVENVGVDVVGVVMVSVSASVIFRFRLFNQDHVEIQITRSCFHHVTLLNAHATSAQPLTRMRNSLYQNTGGHLFMF